MWELINMPNAGKQIQILEELQLDVDEAGR